MKFIALLFFILMGGFIFFIYIWRNLKNKPMYRRIILILLSGLIILMGLIVLKYHNRIIKYFKSSTLIAPIKTIGSQPCNCDGLKIEKDLYIKHRQSAISVSNNRFLKDDFARINFIRSKHLVDVENNKGYTLAPLEYSSSHLTKIAYVRLIELGGRFNEAMELQTSSSAHFVVSSLSRTENNEQQKLRKSEKNATNGTSSHSYGVSFDISEIRTSGDCLFARNILEVTLKSMQDEKKILICPESNCVHITVIK